MSNLPSPLELPIPLTDDQFWQLCQQQEELQFERTAQGDLIIMTLTGGITSDRNSDINFQLRSWNRQYKLGKVFDSSGGFKLPNGADRSPDASWVKLQRWNALTWEQQAKFVPLCPDFIIELRSPNDSLPKLQKKMEEYRDNGAKLGWLIDPQREIIEVYRPDQSVEILDSATTISGENILPGFVLDLTEIFS